MKNNVPNPLVCMIFGAGLGSIIYTVALLLTDGINDTTLGMLVWLIASAAIGLISMVYECDRLTDLTATLIHAPLTFLTALIAGSILDYGDGSILLLLARMLPVIIILYVAVHLLMFLIRRITAHALNQKLSQKD